MAAEDAPVVVHLVDDDVFEAFEEGDPLGVVGHDGGVQHVGVGEDDVAGAAHLAAGVGGGVAVVGEGADVGAKVGDEAVEFVELVLGEGLGGEEVERLRRRVLEDGIEDGDVVAEGLAAGGGGDDDAVAPGTDVLNRLRLVEPGPLDATLRKDVGQAGVDSFGPLTKARLAGLDLADDGVAHLLAGKALDEVARDDVGGDGPDSGDGVGGRRLGHGAPLAQMFGLWWEGGGRSTGGNRLTSVTDWNADETTYAYDNANRMTTVTYPSAVDVVSTYAYDDADRLTGIEHVQGGTTTLASVDYTLDDVGNRTQRVDEEGTHSYTYDDLYRLTEVTYPGPSTTDYVYDAFGNRTSMTVGMDETTYSYNDADQLTSVTPPGESAISYTWDDNGNLTDRGSDEFAWDYEDRMTSATVDSATTTFAYRGDGLRDSRTFDSNTTTFTWDIAPACPWSSTTRTPATSTAPASSAR